MRNINTNTKKAQCMIYSYECAKAKSLSDCYVKTSKEKKDAELFCRADMVEHGGYDFRITGHGIQHFSCAYRYEENGIEYLVYHTRANVYRVAL